MAGQALSGACQRTELIGAEWRLCERRTVLGVILGIRKINKGSSMHFVSAR